MPKRVEELGDKLKKWWGRWNLDEPSTEPFKTEPFGSPRRICPREPETTRNLKNLGGTWTFRGTFWRPKTDLPQRTIESPKAILPRKIHYGWRPQSYCCWGFFFQVLNYLQRGGKRERERHHFNANSLPSSDPAFRGRPGATHCVGAPAAPLDGLE